MSAEEDVCKKSVYRGGVSVEGGVSVKKCVS